MQRSYMIDRVGGRLSVICFAGTSYYKITYSFFNFSIHEFWTTSKKEKLKTC